MVERAERSLGCGLSGFRVSELDGSSSERFPGGDGGIPIGRTDRERVDPRLGEHKEIDSCEEAVWQIGGDAVPRHAFVGRSTTYAIRDGVPNRWNFARR